MKCSKCGYLTKGNECFACGSVINEFKIKEKSKPAKVSKSMGSDLREYSKLRAQFLKENKKCCVFPNLNAVDIHHSRGRGKYLLDITTWKSVSREGHQKIHHYPLWALENGFSISRLAKEEK